MKTHYKQGPWHIGKRYPSGAIYDEKGGEICAFSDLLHPAEVAANARLIAAAPDLLAALQALISVIGVRVDDPRIKQFDAARAALAKAEGNQ
jgi:hypothetical protein